MIVKYMHFDMSNLDKLIKANSLDNIFDETVLLFDELPKYNYVLPFIRGYRGFASLDEAKLFINNNYPDKANIINNIKSLFIAVNSDLDAIDGEYTDDFIKANYGRFYFDFYNNIIKCMSEDDYKTLGRKKVIANTINSMMGDPSIRLIKVEYLIELLLLYVTGNITDTEKSDISAIVNLFDKNDLAINKDFSDTCQLVNKFLDDETVIKKILDRKYGQWDIDKIE